MDSAVIENLRQEHISILGDIETRWRRTLAWFFFAGLTISLTLLYWFTYIGRPEANACTPDGSFDIDPNSFQFWSRSGFFQITIGFGRLDFTQAKVIDVVWDLALGRGGQALLAVTSWDVFQKYIAASMEGHPVTFRTYRTMFLQSGPSLLDLPRIIRDFSARLSLRSRPAMCFIVFTIVLTLAFPTLASSMTGYKNAVQAFIADTNGNLVPFEQFDFVAYVIHDGSRINLTDDYTISRSHSAQGDPVISEEATAISNVDFIGEVDSYLVKYEDALNVNINSSFLLRSTNYALEAPLLNISTYETIPGLFPRAWSFSNHSYNTDYVKTHGTCQPIGSYQWGFSFIQLNLMIFFIMIWTIGINVMWLEATIELGQKDRKEVAKEWKGVLELAHAMRHQLEECDADDFRILEITESCIQKRIRCDINGGSIRYLGIVESPELTAQQKLNQGGLVWLKQNVQWLLFLGVSLPAMVLVIVFKVYYYYFVCAFPPATVIAMTVGSLKRNQFLLFFYISVFSLSVIAATSILVFKKDGAH